MRKKYRELPTQATLLHFYCYDPLTGIFTRRIDCGRWKAGQICGTLSCGYISINVDRTVFRAHRLAWVYMTGANPINGIDHINGVRTDNRWSNLREANQSQNLANKRCKKNSFTQVKGVFRARSKYAAKVYKDGTSIHLGTFETIAEAKAAYDAAAIVLHGDFFRS